MDKSNFRRNGVSWFAKRRIVNRPKQAIAYVYGHADKRDAEIAKSMTLDEATRVASNIHASRSADSRALEPQAQNTGDCAKGETRLGGTPTGLAVRNGDRPI